MKLVNTLVATIAVSLATGLASAHDYFIFPDYFTLASEKPTTVAVDVTYSHAPFRSDYSASSDMVTVLDPAGDSVRNLGAYFEGQNRSTFDLPVDEQGTYKLMMASDSARYMTRYKVGNSDKRLWAGKTAAADKLPEGATEVKTMAYNSQGISFVTNGAPTDAVFAASGEGFELMPLTHPADYVTGDDIAFKLLLDGAPAVDVKVSLVDENARYRSDAVSLDLVSDSEGMVSFNLAQGGRFLAQINHTVDSQDPEADEQRYRLFYMFEVVYE